MQSSLYNIQKIADIVNGKLYAFNSEHVIQTLVTDSRRINHPLNALFFAIRAQKDGHHFLKDAYQNQIRNFIVNVLPDLNQFEEANFIVVDDTLKALQQISAFHRKQFNIPVIGITGSNGKTIVKEWLYQLFAPDYSIIKSPGSYNSQIGVPLSVWQINNKHNLGIFEAGISNPSEMVKLRAVIQPTIGVLTNIREAHAAGFSSIKEKLSEKLQLFKEVDLLIYNKKDIQKGDLKDLNIKKLFAWSRHGKADLTIIDEVPIEGKYYLRAYFQEKEIECLIPFSDEASIENGITCWAVMLALGIQPAIADERLERISKVRMRLELKPGINHCSIIDDSYSADLPSLAIALDFLNQQNQHEQKTVILSDFFETGKSPESLYQEIAGLLEQKKVSRIIGIGTSIAEYGKFFKGEKQFFTDTFQFISALPALSFSKESILIKGARKFEFERISKLLTQKSHDTVLEINLDAMTHNLNFYRSKLNQGVKIMAMVKAFSYGSGSFEIANLLQFNKVDYLAVAYADEGVALKQAGIKLPIMVMSPESSAFDKIIEHNLEPELYSLEVLQDFLSYLSDNTIDYPVHIKLDTGMHRLGFEEEQDDAIIDLLKSTNKIYVKSVFTHLVGSGNDDLKDFTFAQLNGFKVRAEKLSDALGYKFIKHALNTSGIENFNEYQMDMVRLGIGLYGYDASVPAQSLRTVAVLKTTISQVKHIKPMETVGYDRKGIMPNGGKTATVKIGYADGYSRYFGHGVGKMMINGVLVSTIGSICMDMCMLDVTGLDVKRGDEVIVFNDELTIKNLADQIQTIPYEILTNISQRVKRIYFYE